jgi:hypothetical protein
MSHLQSHSANSQSDLPQLSECGSYLRIGIHAERGTASHGYISREDALQAAHEALVLIDLPDALNLRVVEPAHLGFFNVYEPQLVIDGEYGDIAVSIRFKENGTTPAELQLYDANHPKLLEWKTDLSGNSLGEGRALQYEGTASFATLEAPTLRGPWLGDASKDKAA